MYSQKEYVLAGDISLRATVHIEKKTKMKVRTEKEIMNSTSWNRWVANIGA